jgi:chromate reductase, NAD(P)H dehydrogenase (quinone)
LKLLLISGSARQGSTNTAALRTAAVLAPPGVEGLFYDGLGQLPLFNPDDDREGMELHPEVVRMRGAVANADALLICTPEYAGALPAALKNLLEWTIGDAGTYGKPVGWINVSGPAAPTGGEDAHESLGKVLRYAGADVVSAACVRIPLGRDMIDEDGVVRDAAARAGIATAVLRLAEHVAEHAP